MPLDYDRASATAERLIRENGRAIGFLRAIPGNGPAHNPGPATWSRHSPDPYGVTFPATKTNLGPFDIQVEPGTTIDRRFRLVLLAGAGLAVEPKTGDRLEFDGAEWSVLGATPLAPVGTALYWRVGVKLVGPAVA